MIDLVISGGQSGADLGGWRAAKRCSIPTGGWMTHNFATEVPGGSGFEYRPEFAETYGAKGLEDGWWAASLADQFRERTARNAAWGDVTLWFGTGDTKGYWCTRKACDKAGRPFWEIKSREEEPWQVANRLLYHQYKVANIAGNRESSSPGIGVAVERYLVEVFEWMKEGS